MNRPRRQWQFDATMAVVMWLVWGLRIVVSGF